jgi:hypothetical protein
MGEPAAVSAARPQRDARRAGTPHSAFAPNQTRRILDTTDTAILHRQGKERIMGDDLRAQNNQDEIERLTRELEEAELFTQKLRTYIVAIRDEVAGGHAGRALSMCNQALTEVDSATDVVAPSPRLKERAGLDADDRPHGDERG